jgi:mxaJ protein
MRNSRNTLAAAGLFLCFGLSGGLRAEEAGALRVCADPNNLPFSNSAGEGFENKLAEMVAKELGEPVSYTWRAQRRGFIRNTLKAGTCDVVMGVPADLDMVERTRPYYASTYVFVSEASRGLHLASLKDPKLRSLRIGVQLIGDDGFNTPPAHALGQQGIVDNVKGYMIYGDYREPNPPSAIISAVRHGDIDVAAVWGPLAGYFATKPGPALTVTPVADGQDFAPLKFQFAISMGVRRGNNALREKLDRIIEQKQPRITALLESYGVPLVAVADRASPSTAQTAQQAEPN